MAYQLQTISTNTQRLPLSYGSTVQSHIFLPKKQSSSKLPLLLFLCPWLTAGRQAFAWKPFRTSLADRLDNLIETQQIPPVAVAAIDLYTPFGGSQFVDSSYFGDHASIIVHDVLPDLSKKLDIANEVNKRFVFGRSSGGFGALRLLLDFPGVFGGGAIHAGDMAFETTLKPSLIDLCHGLQKCDYDVSKFITDTKDHPKPNGSKLHLMMLLGLSAFYSPNPKSKLGFDLPVDLKTGKCDQQVWSRWLKHDPVEYSLEKLSRLSKYNKLFIDCGSMDQYHLQLGARQLVDRLNQVGVPHVYEEFPDNHSSTDYRYDISLKYLLS